MIKSNNIDRLGKFILALIAIVSIGLSIGFAANYGVTQGSGTTFGSIVVGGINYAQQLICDLTTPSQCAAVSASGAIKVDGSITSSSTTSNSTISVTNTFQAALATSSSRKGCLLQNTGTHTEYIYFGTIGSATTSNSFQISPGQTISCNSTSGLILTDAVNITGTAADGYVVTNQ